MEDNERCKPVTVPTELVQELWREIKGLRDQVAAQWREGQRHEVALNALLAKMKEAGMADWIPTLEEVRAAWREEPNGGG